MSTLVYKENGGAVSEAELADRTGQSSVREQHFGELEPLLLGDCRSFGLYIDGVESPRAPGGRSVQSSMDRDELAIPTENAAHELTQHRAGQRTAQ